MNKLFQALLFVLVVSVAGACVQTRAQTHADNKKAQPPKAEEPQGEVEHMLKELTKKNEKVLTACLENCGDNARTNDASLEKGVMVKKGVPEYSAVARRAHAHGIVEVKVLINKDGKVIAAQVVKGSPLLAPASLKAARETEFKPTQLNGQPVMVTGVIQYKFVEVD